MAVKAVILAAGKGSRLAPLTPFVPKEMLPVGHFPAIHHVLLELANAGISEVMIILSQGKESIREYLSASPFPKGDIASCFCVERSDLLKKLHLTYAMQERLAGTADAIYLAREFMGGDPLVVAYPDDLLPRFGSKMLRQMIDIGMQRRQSGILVQAIEPTDVSQYGVVDLGKSLRKDVYAVRSLIEKPTHYDRDQAFAMIGRLFLMPAAVTSIPDYTISDRDGIIPVLNAEAEKRRLFACVYREIRLDVGSHDGYERAIKTYCEIGHKENIYGERSVSNMQATHRGT